MKCNCKCMIIGIIPPPPLVLRGKDGMPGKDGKDGKDGISSTLGNTLGNTVGNMLNNTSGNTLNNTNGNTLGNTVGNTTGNTLNNADNNTLGNTVGNNTGNTLNNTNSNTLGNTVGNTLNNTNGNTVGNNGSIPTPAINGAGGMLMPPFLLPVSQPIDQFFGQKSSANQFYSSGKQPFPLEDMQPFTFNSEVNSSSCIKKVNGIQGTFKSSGSVFHITGAGLYNVTYSVILDKEASVLLHCGNTLDTMLPQMHTLSGSNIPNTQILGNCIIEVPDSYYVSLSTGCNEIAVNVPEYINGKNIPITKISFVKI